MAKKTSDELVMELMAKVSQKKQEIQKITNPQWKTNLTFGYTGEESIHDRINILTVTDLVKIVDIYTFLLAKEQNWSTATKELGIDLNPKHMSFPISSWKQDLQTRTSQINANQRREELAALEKRIDSLVTVEQRRELELAAIQRELEA